MNPSEKLMEDAREEYARKGVLRQEYHKGYEAGKRARTPEQWQLDMERMEVARRVDAVTLDNGSHGNLSAIASAIYEPRFGWTSGACAMLRDKLVRLLGGAHERDCRGGRDDTGAPRPDNSDGEQAEEVNLLSGDEPNLTEIAETINLGNESDSELMENGENHKIATITDELREWIERQDNNIKEDQYWILPPYDERELLAELAAIADRIDARHYMTSIVAEASTSDEWTAMSEYDKVRRQRDELRAKLDELRGHSRTYPKSGDGMSITDELREFVGTFSKRLSISVAEVNAIADRIDEQFDRICQQQEAVLQSTIDDMCDELSGLEENNAELTANNDELTAKCGELQAKLDKIAGVLDGRD